MSKLKFSDWFLLFAIFALLPGSARAQQATVTLDTTQLIVVGEGLAAGMADFSLRDVYQDKSFGAQMARQMKTDFPQPLFQPPGVGSVPGFPTNQMRLPGTLQGSVRDQFPPYLFVFNLSSPGMTLSDSLGRRPVGPLIQPNDPLQTVTNLVLGYPALIAGAGIPYYTQAEYASAMNPTLAIVELGYQEILSAAVDDDPSKLPDATSFQTNYTALLAKVGQNTIAKPVIIAMTIPDPFDTAYFTTVAGATRLLGAPPSVLTSLYGLRSDDFLTANGMMLIGTLIQANKTGAQYRPGFTTLSSLGPNLVVSAATATAVRTRLAALNAGINNAAKTAGATVYDLQATFSRIRAQGLTVGTRTLTADYLGGFYSLDGFYPGATGHALIANELLSLLNQNFKRSFPLVDLTQTVAADPAVRFTPAIRRKPATEEQQ